VQPVEELVQSSVWKLTAERTTKTWTQVPHFYLSQQVNASRLVGWRDRAQPLVEGGVSYTDLIVKVVAAVLNRHPRLNSRWEDNRVVLNREVNLGIVVATDYGLVVPVIARAETLSLAAIAARRRDLVVRAHERKLRVEELQGGTFTLSNLGMYGVDSFFPIVNAPQAATLGVGRIADQVVVSNRQAVVQSCVTLTLSCDHRTVDGAAAATFLRDLASMMESPSADDCP
jgi:pyruvate dehydrogenase E2 component (dihydrolipoamide acetyltransferase)